MSTIIVDTDVFIDIMRSKPGSLAQLTELEKDHIICVSVITWLELLVGARDNAEKVKIDQFIARYQVLHLSNSSSQIAARLIDNYTLNYSLFIPDALIAATAIEHDIELYTHNKKDFRYISELTLHPDS